jgi:hypothetical protein
MKPFNLRRRMRAAAVTFETGRVESQRERDEREEAERYEERTKRFHELVKRQPQGVWFPSDANGPQWIPNFFKAGKE